MNITLHNFTDCGRWYSVLVDTIKQHPSQRHNPSKPPKNAYISQSSNHKPTLRSPNKPIPSPKPTAKSISPHKSTQLPNHPKVDNHPLYFKVESGSEGARISEGYQSEVYFCTRTLINKESLVTADRKSTFRAVRSGNTQSSPEYHPQKRPLVTNPMCFRSWSNQDGALWDR